MNDTKYKGKPIEALTKPELIIALKELVGYYEARLEIKDKIINILEQRQ